MFQVQFTKKVFQDHMYPHFGFFLLVSSFRGQAFVWRRSFFVCEVVRLSCDDAWHDCLVANCLCCFPSVGLVSFEFLIFFFLDYHKFHKALVHFVLIL